MSDPRERKIFYKAVDRGWQKKDFKRVYESLKRISEDYFDNEGVIFNSIEELAMMLEEDLDYKLEWSLIRLVKDDKIFIWGKGNRKLIQLIGITKEPF